MTGPGGEASGMQHGLDLAASVARRLGAIEGVTAVVLGGSMARGVADGSSDVDLGIYYHNSNPPKLEDLRQLAAVLDENGTGAVTGYGEWGPWVNGGAWLSIKGTKVDWLYRDLERVAQVIEDCRAGRISADYYLGHPHAFHNYIYLGEIAYCRPLFDPGNAIGALKLLTAQYPPAMKKAIAARYLYDARFMLEAARKPAARGDVFEVSGCLFRVAAALVQVLFALNEQYFINENRALPATAGFERCPPRFAASWSTLLGRIGDTPERLTASVTKAGQLLRAVEALATAQPERPKRRRRT